MKFFKTSGSKTFNKGTYINLRWIGILGQLIAIYVAYFFLNLNLDILLLNFFVFIGILSNLFLVYIYQKTQLTERTALIFLLIDIFQISFLLFFTGGITNPYIIFIIIPSIFSSINLSLWVNIFLVFITILAIIILSFYYKPLPSPISDHFHVDPFYLYSIPISLIIALVFFTVFATIFGNESRLRKDALNKIQETMAREHELVSLGAQAAAAAHSLGTPLSTIKIITQELATHFKSNKDILKDIKLLSSQVERCNQILKKLSLNPNLEDDFIDKELSMSSYLKQIIKSFEEISKKKFFLNLDQNSNMKKISKSIELIYGLRNFIGNANKYANKNIFINLKSNSLITEITIEDDGEGFPKDILSKIGEPYLKTNNSKSGLGLGIFIGKTLLEKNYAKINCRNSKTRSGAEIIISWKNADLFAI